MVNIMLGSMPQQRQKRFPVRAGGLARGEQAKFPQQGQEGGLGQMLASQENSHYPSKCIFWCAIALGALIRGCSSDFVSYPLLDTKPIAAAAICVHLLFAIG